MASTKNLKASKYKLNASAINSSITSAKPKKLKIKKTGKLRKRLKQREISDLKGLEEEFG